MTIKIIKREKLEKKRLLFLESEGITERKREERKEGGKEDSFIG